MKNSYIVLPFIAIVATVAIVFSACRKINESTDVGGGLIPPIDNIKTFETFLDIQTNNRVFSDTTKAYFNDNMVLGHISNDPEFGATHANGYFNVSLSSYFTNPFIHKDSVIAIDSVILSLAYTGDYGDSTSFETLRVFEIAQTAGFNDTTLYKYGHADFQTAGSELGAKTFQVQRLTDSIKYFRRFGDTTKLGNVIRIKLDNQLGVRLSKFDTTYSANGGFRMDSIFKTLFRGFAIKADNTGNSLIYISPSDVTKTKLIVYCRLRNTVGVIDTTSVEFAHYTGGEANVIKRTPGSLWASYLTNGIANDDKIYLQSIPGSFTDSASYADLRIPGLDNFNNAVIHRAEIIATPLRSASDGYFVQPLILFLDRVNNAGDSAFTFDSDMALTNNFTSFTYNIGSFGGIQKTDSTYRFNISRYVQNIITRKSTNYKLRLYAPVRAFEFSQGFNSINQIYLTDRPAYGRVVLAGGSYVDPLKRMRLRIVYSKL